MNITDLYSFHGKSINISIFFCSAKIQYIKFVLLWRNSFWERNICFANNCFVNKSNCGFSFKWKVIFKPISPYSHPVFLKQVKFQTWRTFKAFQMLYRPNIEEEKAPFLRKKEIYEFICILSVVLEQFPSGQCSPDNCHLGQLPPGKSPRTIAT